MSDPYGALLFKSEPPRNKFSLIICLFFGGFCIYYGIFQFLIIFGEISIFSIISSFIIAPISIIMGVCLIGLGIMYFITFIKIFEQGIVIRTATLFLFLQKHFIPHEEIVDVEVNVGHSTSKKEFLFIYFRNHEPYWLRSEWVTNIKQIEDKVLELKQGPARILTDIKFYKRIHSRSGGFVESARVLEFESKGTEEDPILLDGQSVWIPKISWLHDNDKILIFRNRRITALNLEGCKNICFENCRIKRLRLENCSTLMIRGTAIKSKTILEDCSQINFKRCSLKKLNLKKSKNLLFKDTNVHSYTEYASKQNIFKDTSILNLETNVKEDSFLNRNELINTTYEEIKPSAKKKESFVQKHTGMVILLILLAPVIFGIILGIILRNYV